jgi:hypothetical protein
MNGPMNRPTNAVPSPVEPPLAGIVPAAVAGTAGAASPRRYTRPTLRRLGRVEDLLEVLGPAQAAYGGP